MVGASWIVRAEAAMRGEPVSDITLVPGHAPSILDAFGRRALIAPFFAAFMWAAVVFRERLGQPLDPIVLLLRLLALALSVRAVLLGSVLLGRLRVYMTRGRYQLALCDEGLLLRTPRADFALQRDDIIDIREHGVWQEHSAARWADVHVVTRPASGRTHCTIPPLFEHTPGVLAERLMRWRGVLPAPAQPVARAPSELASKLFDRVAAGERPDGVAVIEQGRGWLRRGPYATVLLGFAVLEGFLRLPPATRQRVGPVAGVVIGLCLGLVPCVWFILSRREMAPRKGIALVLTQGELLMRTRAGVLRVSWSDVSRLEIASRRAWSILMGPHQARSLVIRRKDEGDIAYAEALLGAPPEVVVALGDAYRKGALS
jgi:hypothetical protein